MKKYIIMNAFAGIGPKGGGSKPDPLAFSLVFAVGVICFPVEVQPPQPPRQFLPWSIFTRYTTINE